MKETWRLQHFLGVAEAGSFHAAARRLNISQPALTKSIRLLEDYFGAELFFRLPRGVRLTEAGEMLMVHAREIEMTWNSAIIEVGAQSTGKGGFMRIGGGPVYSAVFMPSVLADLRRAHPHLQVAVSTDVGTQLLPLLKTGEIRCYAGGMPDNEVILGAEFETQFLYNQESALFVSGTHPLLGEGDVDPAATLDYPWLSLFSGLQANSRIAKYFAQRKLDPPVQALESHSIQIAIKMLAEHEFIGCMPVPLADAYSDVGLVELPLPDFRWSIPTGVTYHRASVNFPPIAAIIRSLKRQTVKLR